MPDVNVHFLKVLCCVAIAACAASCRSTKTIQTVISKKDSIRTVSDSASRNDTLEYIAQAYNGVLKNRVDNFSTFSAKIKVDFEGSDGKKNDFNAMVRLQKDSMLWVSINALLGIEAFRVVITPDSVKVMNKIDRVIQLRSVSYLKEITKLPFTFKELQDLIVGNPVYLDSNIVSYRKEGDLVSLLNIGELFRHLITINAASNFIVQHSKLDDVDATRGRTANITYGDYENKNNRVFSTFRKITVSEKSKLDIEMKYKQYDFNVPLNFPFNVPKNYKLQ